MYSAASPAISGSAVVSEHITGHPHAIASRRGSPKPSYNDGRISASAEL